MTKKYFKIDIDNIKPGQIYLGFSEAFGDFYDEREKKPWKWGMKKRRPLLILDFHSQTGLVKVAFATSNSKFKERIFEFTLKGNSRPYKFKTIGIAWIKRENLLELIGDILFLKRFHIFKNQANNWFYKQNKRLMFEQLIRDGSYSKMSKKTQEYERLINQFSHKEQLNRDNSELRIKRLKLLEISIKYKKNKFDNKN